MRACDECAEDLAGLVAALRADAGTAGRWQVDRGAGGSEAVEDDGEQPGPCGVVESGVGGGPRRADDQGVDLGQFDVVPDRVGLGELFATLSAQDAASAPADPAT
jgi:hypothetical protein